MACRQHGEGVSQHRRLGECSDGGPGVHIQDETEASGFYDDGWSVASVADVNEDLQR
jgi:hypothetical protein